MDRSLILFLLMEAGNSVTVLVSFFISEALGIIPRRLRRLVIPDLIRDPGEC